MSSQNSLENQPEKCENVQWGRWDTAEFWGQLYKEKTYFKDLVFPNLQSNYLDPLDTNFRTLQFNVISEFASIEQAQSEDMNTFDPTLRTICEITCMSSNLKNQFALSTQQSAQRFALVLTHHMSTWAVNINVADVDAEVASITKSSSNTHTCIFSDRTMTVPVENASTDIFMLFIRVLCRLKKKAETVMIVRSAVLAAISIAKLGVVSDGYIKKVVSDIFQDTGITLEIDGKEIREVWRNIGRAINDTNVQDIILMWGEYLPHSALRMRLLVQEDCRGNGLTSLIAIHKAIKAYPDFRWDVMAKLFPDQESAVKRALEAVNGNPYYGYKKDLGPVRSKSYKDYAWVAKELLVKIGGDSALERAACFVRTPAMQSSLNTMITKYKTEQDSAYNGSIASTKTTNDLTAPSSAVGGFY